MSSVSCHDDRDGRAKPAGSGTPELGGVAAVLRHAGAAVPTVVVGVHGEAVGGEGVDEGAVPSGVLPQAVHQLDHRAGRRLRGMDVVDDRDAVCIGELGHAHEFRVATGPVRWRRGCRHPSFIYLAKLMS